MGDSAGKTAIMGLDLEQCRVKAAAPATSAVNDITLKFLRIEGYFIEFYWHLQICFAEDFCLLFLNMNTS